ncbi:MAG: hypothetical protein M1541_13795 [Acidobacteria bacterium]|nr:hypothetical protein [Acidobacteriota bacterium]
MAVERAARACRPSALVVVGGETLAGVARLLGFHGLLVRGETAPGMALAEVRGGPQHGSQIVTKAGDFGERETLAAVIAELSGSLSLK